MRRWAVELDGAEPERAVAEPELLPREALLDARRPRPPLARGAAAARTSRSRSSPASLLERRWVPLRTVGIYVPRNLVSTLVMCAVPAQAAGVERIVVCTPPAGRRPRRRRGRGARDRRGLGARRPAGDRLARLRAQGRQDRRARERLRERGEARRPARRRDRPAGRARPRSSSSRPATSTGAIVDLELAAQAEHGPDTLCRVVETLEEAEAIAPEHLVLLGDAEALAGAGPERRRRLRRPVLARRGRRLRDRRQPRPADERLGALGRRARDRDVPQAGDDAAADRRGARADPPDGRGARRGRGHARARRGGAAMR